MRKKIISAFILILFFTTSLLPQNIRTSSFKGSYRNPKPFERGKSHWGAKKGWYRPRGYVYNWGKPCWGSLPLRWQNRSWSYNYYPYWGAYAYDESPNTTAKKVITDKTLDSTEKPYWEVFNTTDRTLKFYIAPRKFATFAPGEKGKIMRGKTFNFAVVSKSGKLLKNGYTKKHFITIFHKGYAADYTNKKNKWKLFVKKPSPHKKISF